MFALFAMGESLMAQKIDVPDVYASPGQTVAFTMHLSEGQADKYIALQFKAQFPATGFSTVKTNGFIVSDSWPGANAVINDLDDTGLVTIPFDCTNAIQGSKVDYLISIKFKVADDLTAGVYDVTLKDIELQYRENEVSKADKPADVTFKVKVQDKSEADVTLDENSPLAPEPLGDENKNIRVFRTIKANKWSTICLPFRLTTSKYKAAFGQNVKLCSLKSFVKEGDAVKVEFASHTVAMEANTPYLIQTEQDIAQFTVSSKLSEVVASPESSITYWDDEEEENVKYGWFYGVYKAGTVIPEDNLFLHSEGDGDSKFWFSNAKTKSKAFRGYFRLKGVTSTSAPILMLFVDDNVTGISSVKNDQNSENFYNLNGQRIVNPQKGMFIKDGKKVIIK